MVRDNKHMQVFLQSVCFSQHRSVPADVNKNLKYEILGGSAWRLSPRCVRPDRQTGKQEDDNRFSNAVASKSENYVLQK